MYIVVERKIKTEHSIGPHTMRVPQLTKLDRNKSKKKINIFVSLSLCMSMIFSISLISSLCYKNSLVVCVWTLCEWMCVCVCVCVPRVLTVKENNNAVRRWIKLICCQCRFSRRHQAYAFETITPLSWLHASVRRKHILWRLHGKTKTNTNVTQ